MRNAINERTLRIYLPPRMLRTIRTIYPFVRFDKKQEMQESAFSAQFILTAC
jgi:hypothetical protein